MSIMKDDSENRERAEQASYEDEVSSARISARIKELGEINRLHQELNGKLQTRLTDVEEDNKKLSDRVADYIKKYENAIRKAGL